jgi:hypothetical protein
MKAKYMVKLLEYVPEVKKLAEANTIGLRIFFDALPILANEGLAKTVVHVHSRWYEIWTRYNVETDELECESPQKDCLAAILWCGCIREHGWIAKCVFREEIVPLLLAALCATAEFRLLSLETTCGDRFDTAWDLGL